MEEYFSRVVSGFMFSIIFLSVVATYLLFASYNLDTHIDSETVKFINKCASTGQVDPALYYAYASDISKVGNYTIRITHESINQYSSSTDNYVTATVSYTQDEILDYMYGESENKAYSLKAGDLLTIKVIKNSSDLTTLFEALTMQTPSTVISEHSVYVGES